MKIIIVAIIIFVPFFSDAQMHVNFSMDGNYWEHTDLYGLQGGLGFEYRSRKWALRSTFNFGYGEYNRFKDFEFGAGRYTTLRVDYAEFQTNTGFSLEEGDYKWYELSLRNTKTDYARQHQFDLMAGYKILDRERQFSIWVYGGMYTAMIDHLYVIDVFQAHELSGRLTGTLNAVVYSDQRFYTIGGQLETAIEWKHKNTYFAYYVRGGLGPNYTSFASTGLRITGIITKE